MKSNVCMVAFSIVSSFAVVVTVKSTPVDVKNEEVVVPKASESKRAAAGFTAFSAARVTNVPAVSVDTVISYDRIDTIVGTGFDGTTFSAPVKGVYLFTFAGKGSSMAIHLKLNGATMRSLITNDEDDLTGNSSSNSVVLELDAGDLVQTYQSDWSSGIVNESPSNGVFTSFSGILLQEVTSQ